MNDATPAPERLLPVPDWGDLYEVSSQGYVRSLRRGIILKPSYTNSGGYALVVLCRNGTKKAQYVHQLVLEAFVGPCPVGMETRHLDGDPTNNHWAPGNEEETRKAGGNLIYGTKRENQFDQVTHGTHPWASRDLCENDHELTEDNTWIEYYEDGTFKARRCKACNRDRSAKQREKRKIDDRRCKEDGCGKPYLALDWCAMHYAQNYKQRPGNAGRVAARNAAWYKERKESGNPSWKPAAELSPEQLERRRELSRERQRRYQERKRQNRCSEDGGGHS
jgi:hypothetical protein